MDEYVNQFEVVQERLKEIVDKDEVLRHRGKSIMYNLHMVGTEPLLAVPTVVVECTLKDQKRIRDAFNRHSIDNFHCYHESKSLRKSISGPRKIPPPFRLVYRVGFGDPYEQKASETQFSISLSHDSTLCGSLVSFQGRSATLALTLEVNSEYMILTAGHLKSTPESSVASTTESNHDDEVNLNGNDVVQHVPLWVDDDDEYDMEAAALQPLPARSPSLNDSNSAYANDRVVSSLQDMRTVELGADLGLSQPDLDWMLLKYEDSAFCVHQPNLMYLPGQPEPILLKDIAEKPRMHAVPVFVVSGVRGVIKGRMLGMPTFIGSRPYQKSCKAWSVVLDNHLVVLPGESGSVVVDQDTFSVYGHVIGSDRLGHALTVPLCDTITQVKFALKAKSVHLPEKAKPVSADAETQEGSRGAHQSPHRRLSSHELPERLSSNDLPDTWHSEVDQNVHALEKNPKEAGNPVYKCKCGLRFDKHSYFKRHIEDHANNFVCPLCDSKFNWEDKLVDHYRSYHRVSDAGLRFLHSSLETKTEEDAFPLRPPAHARRDVNQHKAGAASDLIQAPTFTDPSILTAAPQQGSHGDLPVPLAFLHLDPNQYVESDPWGWHLLSPQATLSSHDNLGAGIPSTETVLPGDHSVSYPYSKISSDPYHEDHSQFDGNN